MSRYLDNGGRTAAHVKENDVGPKAASIGGGKSVYELITKTVEEPGGHLGPNLGGGGRIDDRIAHGFRHAKDKFVWDVKATRVMSTSF